MFKSVQVMSAHRFVDRGWNLESANLPLHRTACISCRQNPGHPAGDDYAFRPDDERFITLFFDDCIPGKEWFDRYPGAKPFTVEQAAKVIDHIEAAVARGDENVIVHCSAGISRSGAIASFIVDNFTDMDYQEWKSQNAPQIHPNEYVYGLLRRELMRRKGIEISE